jgi:Flp pilus assembly protein TadD
VEPVPARIDAQFGSLVARGLQAAEDGALPEAVALFRQALALRPTHAETWNTLGVVLVRQGDLSGGIGAFHRALRAEPDHPEAHRNLAVALDRQGRPGDAVAHYRAFLRLSVAGDPGRDDVLRRLAEVAGTEPGRGEPARPTAAPPHR